MYSEQRDNTFSASIKRGDVITAACQCGHRSRLNLDWLVARFGYDFDHYEMSEEIRKRLVCRSCGRKRPVLEIEYGDPNATKKLWDR